MNKDALVKLVVLLALLPACGRCGGRVPMDARLKDDPAGRLSEQRSQASHGTGAGCSEERVLKFADYDWRVKCSEGRVGPGPNYFSDSEQNVEVDERGRLHLRITHRAGRWYCAEVISTRSFGHGTYRFYLDSAAESLDPQVVLGLFTWNDDPDYDHREIDVEISRWGRAKNRNGQFVIQPYTRKGNLVRFQIPRGIQASSHSFTWAPESVFCQSLKGHHAAAPKTEAVIQQHLFKHDIPQAGGENARINLWTFAGQPPSKLAEAEVIISRFEFEPVP